MAVERSMQVRLDMLVGDYIRNASSASKATMGIATAAQAPKSALDRVGQAATDVGKTIVSAAGVGVAAMATWAVGAFAAGAAFNTLQQTAGKALETVLGSSAAASAQMEELVGWAKTSPFPRQLWIEAQQTMLGFGFAAEDIVPTLAAIQDGMVAVGGGEQQIREVIQVLAQVNSTGKVTAETLNQLAYRGIDAATLLGDAFGKTATEIRDDVSAGAIEATDFISTLTDSLQTRFAGAAEGLRTTWVGAVDRIKGATRDVGAIMAEPFIDPQGGGAAVQWANDVADALRALEAIARPAMEVLRDRAEPAFEAASEAAQRFSAALREVDLVGLIDRLSAGAPVFAAFGVAAAAAGSASVLSAVGMGALGAAISPVAAGIITLAAASPELRSALVDLLTVLAPLIPVVTDLVVNVADLATSGVGLAGSLMSVLVPAVSVLVTLLTPVLQAASGLAQVLDALPTPILVTAAAVTFLTFRLQAMVVALTAAVVQYKAIGALALVPASFDKAAAGAGRLRMALAGIGIGAIVIGAVALADAFDDTAEQLERVRSVDVSKLAGDLERLFATGEQTGGLKVMFGESGDAAEGFAKQLDIANASWTSWSNWWDTSGNEKDAAAESIRNLDTAMTEMVASGEDADAVLRKVAAAYDLSQEQVDELLPLLSQYTAEADRQAAANRDGADAADEYADGLEGVEEQAESTRMSLKDLADEMQAQTDPIFAAIKATTDLTDAEQTYQDVLAEFGAGSKEANDAMVKMLEAQQKAILASGELAEATGGELTPEFLALAEAAGLTADDLLWLTGQIEDSAQEAQDYAATIMDVNADLTESGGFMKAKLALIQSGMSEDTAQWALSVRKSIDAMIADGMSYEEAIAVVAEGSGKSIETIEQWFIDARIAGMEFSDDYPATVRLDGAGRVMSALDILDQRINAMNKTVTISFRHRNFGAIDGVNIPGMSEGGRVEGPFGAGDVVPRMLQPGEHVWTVREVQGAGGHAGVEALRAAALAGQTRVTHSWSPMPSQGMSHSGINVENVNIEAISERLDARQVQNELRFLAVA